MARVPLRDTIAAQEEQIDALIKANEQVWSSYTMLERRVEELSYIDLNNITGATEDVLPQAKKVETVNRIRRLRHENPMAKQAIKLPIRFVFGKGISYEIKDPNTKRIVDAFWNDPVNQAVWTSHFAQTVAFDELLTDGEQFPVFFPATGEAPYVRVGMIPMEEITHILYDPDNGRLPVWYRRVFKRKIWDPKLNNGEGAWKPDADRSTVRYYRNFRITDEHLADIEKRGLVIPENMQGEGFVKHRMINPVRMRSGLRGVSELFASREWFRVFKEFMEDRGAINAAANALAYQRKIAGSPADVSRLSGKLGGMQVGPSTDQPLTPASFRRPLAGSMIDTNRSDITSIRADTGAPNAARDAEMLLTAAGSGTATPNHYFGGTNAALAGAQAVEVAVVKAFEDFQTYLRNDYIETVAYVMSIANDVPIDEVMADIGDIAWNFPPIMTQDIVKWVTGYAQWAQQVAPKNRVVRAKAIRKTAEVLNISDISMIWDEIEAEEKRLADIEDQALKDAQDAKKAAADATLLIAKNGGVPPPKNGNNGNGGAPPVPVPAGQKTTTGPQESGVSPDLMRLKAGRPPREGATGPRSKRQ